MGCGMALRYSISDNDFEKARGRRSYWRISPTDNALKIIIWKTIQTGRPAGAEETFTWVGKSIDLQWPGNCVKFQTWRTGEFMVRKSMCKDMTV